MESKHKLLIATLCIGGAVIISYLHLSDMFKPNNTDEDEKNN